MNSRIESRISASAIRSAQNVTSSEIELPYLKDPKGFSLAVSLSVSLEPYLFLSASRPSGLLFLPLIGWPQKDEIPDPNPSNGMASKTSFRPPIPDNRLVSASLVWRFISFLQ